MEFFFHGDAEGDANKFLPAASFLPASGQSPDPYKWHPALSRGKSISSFCESFYCIILIYIWVKRPLIFFFLQAGKNYMLREFSTRESKIEELQVRLWRQPFAHRCWHSHALDVFSVSECSCCTLHRSKWDRPVLDPEADGLWEAGASCQWSPSITDMLSGGVHGGLITNRINSPFIITDKSPFRHQCRSD